MSHALVPALPWLGSALLSTLLLGCVDQGARAQLANSMNRTTLPKVAACWEAQSEQPDFAGDLHAVATFDVASGSGAISHASIQQLRAPDGGDVLDASRHPFGRCLVTALNGSRLGSDAWSPSDDLQLTDVLLHFAGPSRANRFDGPPRLVGPRADRCQGLYGHRPPRDAANVHRELSEAEGRFEDANQDRRARAHQRAYDLTVELVARLERDLRGNEQPKQAKKRLKREAKRVRALQEKLGREIGCPTAP